MSVIRGVDRVFRTAPEYLVHFLQLIAVLIVQKHAKTLVGLDQHQVRTWTSWRRWTLIGMLTLALLTIVSIAAAERETTTMNSRITLTRNEVRHLISMLITAPVSTAGHIMGWSDWRRRHQHQARTSHHQRRTTQTA